MSDNVCPSIGVCDFIRESEREKTEKNTLDTAAVVLVVVVVVVKVLAVNQNNELRSCCVW